MSAPKIDRRCHWLRRNSKSRRPEAMVFVDVEARFNPLDDKRVEHSLRLGWACFCKHDAENGLQEVDWLEFDDALTFWHWAMRIALEHKEVYVVAHNIAYDARLLQAFSVLPGNAFLPDYAIMGESCTFFTFQCDKAKIHLLDNSNYWQVSLEDLGKEFGLPKGDVDFDNATDAELSLYCKRDVEILVKVWQFWLSFLDEHNMGDFAITAASQAWNAYRHRFMYRKIGIHNRQDAIDLERASYRGGRTEVFRVGKFNSQNYYKLDVNGLYAYCMAEFLQPYKLLKIVVARNLRELATLMERWLAIADVIVETDKPYYPTRLNKQNAFPTGTFRTQLCTPELQHALREDHLRAIGQVALYEPANLFMDFINTLTPLRQRYKAAGDTGRSLICKLLRNTLYGKFAQKGYRQELLGDAPLDAVNVRRWVNSETGDRCVDWTFGGKTIRQYYEGENFDSFPAISSHISAYARAHMLALLELAGEENCFYMDTDSLIVNECGYQRLEVAIDKLKLGHLKVESVSSHLEIYAKKAYTLGSKTTIKGIKKKATQTGKNTWSQWHFTTLNQGFKQGNLGNVLTYRVEKEIHHTIATGSVLPDGRVKPAEMCMKARQVWDIVKPESGASWTWWVDVPWLASLPQPQPPIDLESLRLPFRLSGATF